MRTSLPPRLQRPGPTRCLPGGKAVTNTIPTILFAPPKRCRKPTVPSSPPRMSAAHVSWSDISPCINYVFCSGAAGEKPPVTGIENGKTSNADLVQALKDGYAYCNKIYSGMTDSKLAENAAAEGRLRRLSNRAAVSPRVRHSPG